MKTQLENIHTNANSSFHLMRNPRLSDLFFWHFHPEYELVYIECPDGPRHVGSHTSRYKDSDLVFIGSNIPHLNFDYGVTTDYEKVVLHIQPSFMEKMFKDVPELSAIFRLFQLSQHGIAFSDVTKKEVGQRLKVFHLLAPFEQFLSVMEMLQILATSDEAILLHNQPVENQYSMKEQKRLRKIYAFIDDNYQRKIAIQEVADLSNLTKAAFCRYFKKATSSTFVNFLNQYRVSQAKRLLMLNKNVSEACYECGFESLSYFNRTFKQLTNENPSEFKKRQKENGG